MLQEHDFDTDAEYEAPSIEILGSVPELTQVSIPQGSL
jgi:hypothetical protein